MQLLAAGGEDRLEPSTRWIKDMDKNVKKHLAPLIPIDALVNAFSDARATYAGPVMSGGLLLRRTACAPRGVNQPRLFGVMQDALSMAVLLWAVAALGIAALWWLTA